MTALLILVFLLIIAYLSSKFFERKRFESTWIKSIAYTGSLYLFLGYLIGPQALNLINRQISEQLNVLYALVLGWVGFLIGLQVNVNSLKRFLKSYYLFASTNFLISLFIAFLLLYFAFSYYFKLTDQIEILVLALATAVSSPIMIGVIVRDHKVKGKVAHLLQFVAAYDNILGILLLGIMMALITDLSFLGSYQINIEMIILSIAIGILTTYFYHLLSKNIKGEQENFLLILGLLIFLVGIAYYLNQSLLFIAFVFGTGLSHLPVSTKKQYLILQEAEKPLYILLLIFVGVNINFASFYYIIYLVIFLVINITSKLISGYLANYIIIKSDRPPGSIGLANVGLGGLSLAIILDFHLTNISDYSKLLIFIVAMSIIINDVISIYYLKNLFVLNRQNK